MTTLMRTMVAAAAVSTAVGMGTGPALADPPATQVLTAVAVGPNGQPINGYQERLLQGNLAAVTDCSAPSPSAVGNDIYACSPTAAGADACWPSTPGSLLCLDDPRDKTLHRVTFGGTLPHVAPPAVADPIGLVLDDGTLCRLRNGGAWGVRDDGYEGAFWCSGSNLRVLWLPSQGPGTCVDRSTASWTVKVGQLGSPNEHFPPPQTRTVTTAWFVGDS
jgi:hypothetical protein